MNYQIYQLHFTTSVRFGIRSLADTGMVFQADTLFSALCQEALAQDGEDGLQSLYAWAEDGNIRLSDAMPYKENTFYLPKPIAAVRGEENDSDQKKLFKRLKYISADQMKTFLQGKYDVTISENQEQSFGQTISQTKAAIHPDRDTEPYLVTSFKFSENCGLYVILGYQTRQAAEQIERWMKGLAASGLGGRRSSGLGKFEFNVLACPEGWKKSLEKEAARYILLNTAMAREEELVQALEGAEYLLVKRGGFIDSETFSDKGQFYKKRDTYCFKSGSCFANRFDGQVYDVSAGGNHPVYRYAKAMFWGV